MGMCLVFSLPGKDEVGMYFESLDYQGRTGWGCV